MPLPVNWNNTQVLDFDNRGIAKLAHGSYAILTSQPYFFSGIDLAVLLVDAAGELISLVDPPMASETDTVRGARISSTADGFAIAKAVDTGVNTSISLQLFTEQGIPSFEYFAAFFPPNVSPVFDLTTLSDGRLLVVWKSQSNQINASIYSANTYFAEGYIGSLNPYPVSSNVMDIDVAAMPNGGYVVLCNNNTSVLEGRIFNSSNIQVGSEFRITGGAGKSNSAVTVLNNGLILATWETGAQGLGQLFTTTGLKLGPQILIHSGSAVAVDLQPTPDGGFMAVFGNPTSPSTTDITLKTFSATGQLTGTMVAAPGVNGTSPEPYAAFLADGRIAVSWTNLGRTETRILDPRGNVINGTSGDDVLFGNGPAASSNQAGKLLVGGAGNDVIYAGPSDTVRGGAGDDILVANPGSFLFYPTVDFSDATSGVVVDGNAGTASGASTGNDILFGAFTSIIGGSGNDIISAFDQFGSNGPLTLDGGAGDDVFRRLQYTKTIIGGDGIDTMDASTTLGDANLATPGVTVDLAAGTWILHGVILQAVFQLGRTVSSVENVIGMSDSDTITGNHLANVLDGGAGNDSISGGEGNDTLIGGAGNDSLNGGDDIDTLSYAAATGAISISLASSSLQNVGGGQGSDIVSNIENLIGSSFADLLNGDLMSNTIWGGNGDDRLFGNNDDDVLYGEAGNDQLIGGAGADTLVGGEGNDRYFVDGIQDEIVEAAGQGIDRVYTTGDYTLDEGVDIEFLYVANTTGGLELTGNSAGNTIYGSIFATVGDTLSGAGGEDTLYGQSGDDRLDGGSGIDSYFGGTGADVFVLQNTFAGRDLLRDFVAADDQLEVSRSVFGNFDNAGAVAAADWFVSNTTGRAADANDRFIYNSTIGYLYFDADGTGAGARVLIARSTGLAPLTAADFNVVA